MRWFSVSWGDGPKGERCDQWQAHDVPQPPDAAGVLALDDALSDDAAAAAGAAGSVLAAEPVAGAAADAPPEPPRKSVTYQPEPLSWKPAAVSCFLNAGAPHAGQSVSGASLIFCSTSLAWPQASHR